MMQRIKRVFEAGTDLLELRAQVLLRSLEQVGMAIVGYFSAAVLALIGAGVLLAGGTVLLAEYVGAAFALLIVGGALVLIGGIIFAVLHEGGGKRHRSKDELLEDIEFKKNELQAAFRGETEEAAEPERHAGVQQAIMQSLTKDPALIATACFAVISFLGLKRSMRLLGAATAAARFIHSVQGNLKRDAQERPVARGRVRATSARARATTSSRMSNGQWEDSARR